MGDWQVIRKSFEIIDSLLNFTSDKSCHTYIRAKEFSVMYGSYRYSEDYDTVEKWDKRYKLLLKSIREKNKRIKQLEDFAFELYKENYAGDEKFLRQDFEKRRKMAQKELEK